MPRAYRAKILTPVARSGRDAPALRFEPDGLLVVGDDGRIAAVEPWSASSPASEDLRPAVVVPGFVDAHVHYPQTRIVGSASGPLLPWLERSVFPEEARFADPAYARDVADELVAGLCAVGTTAAAIFSSSHPEATALLFAALELSGLRAVAGLTLMDARCPDALRRPADEALAAVDALAERWHGASAGRLRCAVTPRFALSCTRELLERAGALAARRRLWIQTHVAENADEDAATRLAHPWAQGDLDVYERSGLLGPRTLLAHAIHLSPADWSLVAARGARVVHCPDSNFFLGSGRMRVADARAHGVAVALGSDVAAGRGFSVRRAMACAYDNALCAGAPVEPAELFVMATLGGARVLGFDDVGGSLEVGKDADFAVLALPGYVHGLEAVLGHVVFASDVLTARRTFVRGRCVHGA